MIQDSIQECDLRWAPFNTVHLLIHTPSSMTTSGPIVTLGPILQLCPILALGSCLKRKLGNIKCLWFTKTNHSQKRFILLSSLKLLVINTCMMLIIKRKHKTFYNDDILILSTVPTDSYFMCPNVLLDDIPTLSTLTLILSAIMFLLTFLDKHG